MKLKDISNEELENMNYAELAEAILNDKGSAMKIVDIFKKICKIKKMSDAEFENYVTNFFELVSTDKTFIVLDKGFCDLRKKHNPTLIVEDEEEETVEVEESEDTIEDEEEEEDIFYDSSSEEDDIDTNDDELGGFAIVDEEEDASM